MFANGNMWESTRRLHWANAKALFFWLDGIVAGGGCCRRSGIQREMKYLLAG